VVQQQHIQKYGAESLIEIIEADKAIVEKNLDGDKDVAMVKGEGLNEHTVQSMCFPGIEFNPGKGEKLVVVPINGSDSYMVTIGGVNENIAPDCSAGERRIYSVSEDGETLKAFAKFKNDGVIELNGNDNFAVLYTELATAFNELQDHYNEVVNSLITWVPVATDGGGALKTLLTGIPLIPSTADITPSKSENVLLKSN